MKKRVIIISIAILIGAIVSCQIPEVQNKQSANAEAMEQLYQKYKKMITQGNGCSICISCAELALAISYDTKTKIKENKVKLLKYYKENGSIPCPELLPEIKKDFALNTSE